MATCHIPYTSFNALECGLRSLEMRTEEIHNRSQEVWNDLASRNKSGFVLCLVEELKAPVEVLVDIEH